MIDADDMHDEMVERIDEGDECPHCHSNVRAGCITRTRDLSGAPLYICGCSAQWLSYTDVTRPREVA